MNCDRIAKWYQWLEYLTFGTALAKRRNEYLHECLAARRALILGDGDGRFTGALLERNPTAAVDSVDLSANMLRQAARRIPAKSSVQFLHADAMAVPLAGGYDLIVTHFFLDCLSDSQVEQLVLKVAAAATANAKWLVSDFQIPSRGFWRWAGTVIVNVLYFCFRRLTGLKVDRLPRHQNALMLGGFHRIGQETALGGLLISELWERS